MIKEEVNTQDILDLIKDIETNILSLEVTIKYYVLILKDLNKLYVQIYDSVYSISSSYVVSPFNNTVRHVEVADLTNNMIDLTKNSLKADTSRYAKLSKNFNELEVFYNNQCAKLKAESQQQNKKIKNLQAAIKKKKNSKILDQLNDEYCQTLEIYLKHVFEVETNIYKQFLSCFKEFHISQANESRKFLDKHAEIYLKLNTFNNSEVDIESPLSKIFHCPQNYLISGGKSKNHIDKHKSEPVECIAYLPFCPKHSGCLGFNSGDIVYICSENNNGWVYITNKTSNKEGWAPLSYLKKKEEVKALFTT